MKGSMFACTYSGDGLSCIKILYCISKITEPCISEPLARLAYKSPTHFVPIRIYLIFFLFANLL